MKGHRARITVPDLVYILASLAFLAALYPVFRTGLENNLADIGTGPTYLLQLILPLAVLVMLSLIWTKAAGGAS